MTKVVVLAHVKASRTSSSSSSSAARRIPWQGGKIVSNKEEALRKFYERKVSAGGALNDHQLAAVQKTLGITVGKEHAGGASSRSTHHPPSNPKKLHATHRPHSKVQASANKTIVINGRVLGPKVTKNHHNLHSNSPTVVHAAGRFVKPKNHATKAARPLALEDKLTLPLDALVSSGQKRPWK